jgi:hypothetical protein
VVAEALGGGAHPLERRGVPSPALPRACVSAAVLLVQPGSDTAPVGEVKLVARILAMLGGGAVALVAAHFPGRRATKPTGTE